MSRRASIANHSERDKTSAATHGYPNIRLVSSRSASAMSLSALRAVGILSPTGAEAIHGSLATALPRPSSRSHSSRSIRAASAPAAPGGSRNHDINSARCRVADSRAVGVGVGAELGEGVGLNEAVGVAVSVGLGVGPEGANTEGGGSGGTVVGPWSPQAINRAATPANPYAQVHRVIG